MKEAGNKTMSADSISSDYIGFLQESTSVNRLGAAIVSARGALANRQQLRLWDAKPLAPVMRPKIV